MNELPISVLLAQLSHELGALQLMAADMEATVDDMIERHATFAANTAALAAPGCKVDGLAAVTGIKLASLAQRLSRGTGHAVKDDSESYELFV